MKNQLLNLKWSSVSTCHDNSKEEDMKGRILVLAMTVVLSLVLTSALYIAAAHGEEVRQPAPEKNAEKTEWTCGMHPSVRMNEPGKCPICNMDLVPVQERQEKAGPVTVKLGERARLLAGVATSEVKFLPLYKEIITVGRIDYDERKVANATSRVAGRIDKLYVDFTGTEVKRGEPLVYLYSPSLVSTQDEYLWALKMRDRVKDGPNQEADEAAQSLVKAARNRLLLWGITKRQIRNLERTGKANDHMTIVSPIAGTVIRKIALEGNYVKEGDHLYHIADLSNLWIYADIYENEISWIKEGQNVKFTSIAYPGEEFHGKVSFIDPFLDERTRSVKVRVDVPNPGLKLRPGMFANATFNATPQGDGVYHICPMHPEVVSENPGECEICGMDLVEVGEGVVMAVPKSAVLDTGKRKMVYVEKEQGVYEAREVVLGPEGYVEIGDRPVAHYPVKKGLMEGEKVVTKGNFLIDSQSQLSGPAASMYDAAIGKEEPTKPIHQH